MSPSRLAGTAVCLLFLAGCRHAGHQSSARTLDANQTRVGVALGASMWRSGDVIMPAPTVQARMNYGISDHVEFGVTGGPDGLGVQTKFALVRSESAQSGFNLGLEPGVSAGPLSGDVVITARLPLLVGYRIGGHELTLGPRLQYLASFGSNWRQQGLLAGATLGARIQATAHFIVSPELGWLQPLPGGRATAPLPILNVGFAWE